MSAIETRRPTGDAAGMKDRKSGLSCAECRRSKLKCDRSFPCQSCIRRGCAAICPDGTLAATKGNKVLMAHAQRLTDQIKSMSARIEELEHALAQSRSETGARTHPSLANREVYEIPDLQTIYDTGLQDISDSIGSLSIGVDGQAKYHGETAGSEYLHELLLPVTDITDPWTPKELKYLGLPSEIVELVISFPLGLRDCPYTKLHFLQFLPSRDRVLELADKYYENVAWMYDPIIRDDFMKNIVDQIYGITGIASLDSIHSHYLSVFFILLASGVYYDSHPSALLLAEQYHSLARAALALDSLLQEATCATVQSLFMIVRFMYNSDRASNETRWLLSGLCARVAQSIGLQRDSSGWNLDKGEVQRRRILFWEMYTADSWTSIVNGRPPSLNIQHTDCRFPDDVEPSTTARGTELGWHAWKFRYSACCLSLSVQHIFSVKIPVYAGFLELDRKIRQFPLPTNLQSPMQTSEAGRAWSSDPARAMQQYCVVCERESNLLYIHRGFFAQAIREHSQNPLQHKFAPSVLATYRSACHLISSLKGVYALHPNQIGRVWFFWSGIFSSCVVLGALIVESPGCELAQNALLELEQALAFYEAGSRPCRPNATMATLEKLHQRALNTFASFYSGDVSSTKQPSLPASQPHISPSGAVDELEVLGGRKSVVITKSTSNSPTTSKRSGSSLQSSPRSLPPSHASSPGDTQPEDGAGMTYAKEDIYSGGISLMDYYDAMADVAVGGTATFDIHPARGSDTYNRPMTEDVLQPGQHHSKQYLFEQPLSPFASIPFVPRSQQQLPQPQSLNAIGFVTPEEMWRNFVTTLGI